MEHLLSEEAMEKYGSNIRPMPWFGFGHDLAEVHPPIQIQDYPIQCGLTRERLDFIHEPFQEHMPWDPTILPMLQSMIFFGA